MLNEMIAVAKGFQASVNISYDLYNDDKVRAFIPTASSMDVIEEVMLSTSATATQRARILIGAYGRGKSHIVLVLLSLLFKKDRTLFNTLLNKIKVYNSSLYEFISNYLDSDSKLLPIVVSGSSTSLTQSFLNALQVSLSEAGLTGIMPDTHFQAAINSIQTWKENYPDTYERFKNEIAVPVDDFIISLRQFNVAAFEQFTSLYPTLTSGSAFNPFVGFDVVEVYEKVVEKLPQYGFNGVFVVYDEFSKYLESSIANATISDIKLLQDFAEKCDRSGKHQMHLMLICHKDISNYIDTNLPKEKVDGWRGVSGRFIHMNLHNNYAQMYEIISSVIIKNDPYWDDFYLKHIEIFNSMTSRYLANGKLENSQNAELCVSGCYPLHPVSTFILPRISEKIAQNERTLFTFLSTQDKHTLPTFIDAAEGDFPMLTPDCIFDYFESLMRKEPYTSELRKLYKLTSSILNKLEDGSLEAKIVKAIALIYAIEQFEKIAPVYSTIVGIYQDIVDDPKEIDAALSALIDKECLVYLKRSNGYLKLKESSGIDIAVEIKKTVAIIRKETPLATVLNVLNNENYIYPNKFNDEYEMVRYFDFTFISSKDYWDETDWCKHIYKTAADGIVYAILPESEDDISNIRADLVRIDRKSNRILFIVPIKYVPIEDAALEYQAAKLLKMQVEDDDLLSDEYDIYIEDLEEIVMRFISAYLRPEHAESEYYYCGKRRHLTRKAQLSALLSDICLEAFPHTPIINNESINKNDLPTVAINSRTKILTGLVASELNANLGLTGTGQDVSIMRSVLIRTGILINCDTYPEINLQPEDAHLRYTLSVIGNFITSSDSEHEGCFGQLYDDLTGSQCGIGIRRGVIPILLAAVLHVYRKQMVIKHNGIEEKLTATLLNDINDKPEAYTVFLEGLDEERTQYLKELEILFADYIVEKEKGFNNFAYITLAMNRWYMALPKYAKEMAYVYQGVTAEKAFRPLSKSRVRFIKSIKQPIQSARDYLFKGVFKSFYMQEFNIEIVSNISTAKNEYETALDKLITTLITDTKTLFSPTSKQRDSLCAIVKKWTDGLKSSTTGHLFPYNENHVIELFQMPGVDDTSLMRRLCKTITSLRIEDWTDSTITEFIESIRMFKKTVEDFDQENAEKTEVANSYKLTFVDATGNESIKTFTRTEYSKRAKLLYNEVQTAVEEMGQAISEQEKRQVLIEILEKLC